MKSHFKTFLKKIIDSILSLAIRNQLFFSLLKYIPKGYNHVLDIVLTENNTKNYIVFDVGANIGQSINFYRKNLNNPIIYSFEPVKDTFEKLYHNSKKLNNIYFYNIALGSKIEDITIQLSHQNLDNSLIKEVSDVQITNKFETIKVSTIDNICEKNNIKKIDILKVDTEGYDLEVLKGSKEMLKNRAIKYIYCEVGFNEEADKIRLEFINDFLRSYDFKFCGLSEVHRTGHNYINVYYANALFKLN